MADSGGCGGNRRLDTLKNMFLQIFLQQCETDISSAQWALMSLEKKDFTVFLTALITVYIAIRMPGSATA